MRTFFDSSQVNKKVELLSYSIYFIIITLLYLTVNIPIVNMIGNLVLFFLLTLNYQASIKSRIIFTVFMYMILMAIESIIVLLSRHLYSTASSMNPQSKSIIGMISIKMISYVVVLLIGNYNDMKKGVSIPTTLWVSIFIIPLGSLYIMIVILQQSHFNTDSIAISIAILLTINIIVFYLYSVLGELFKDKVEKIMLKEQNKYYQKQLEIMSKNNEDTRAFNHDLRNHLSIIRGYIQLDANEKACKYIDKMAQNDYMIKEISSCGNIDIDTVLNYTLYEATKKNIFLSLEVNVPTNIDIASFDIVVILGNLLDNAIEASSKVKNDDKKIDIIIKYKTDILFIHIKNTFDGSISYEKDNIITSKGDRKNHGIGLNNIRNTLKKYDGSMEINHNNNVFCVDIKMYIKDRPPT